MLQNYDFSKFKHIKMKHLKILTTLLFTLFTTINSYSQTFEWLKTKPIDYTFNPDYLLTSTVALNDGSVYFFGMDEFSLNYGIAAFGSLFLTKFDGDGNLILTHIIEGEAAVTGIISDDYGNVYLFGQYHSEINFWGQLTLQMNEFSVNHFFVKIDENGNVLWGKNTNELNEFFQHLFDAIADDEGNTYIGYDTWSDSYISKLNPNGEVISTIIQEDVANISGLSLDGDGNIIVVGSCAGWQSVFNGTPAPAPFAYTNYIAKYSVEMELSWVNFVEDVTCTFTKVVVDTDNNIYWSGPMFTSTSFGELQSDGPAWVYDFFLVKLNAAGEYQWLREVPETVTGDASTGNLHCMEINNDGNIILGGFTRGNIEWEDDVESVSNGLDLDIIVWEFNTDGTVEWVKQQVVMPATRHRPFRAMEMEMYM